MPVCPSCGQENPAVARFCLACGAPLRAAEERREERKIVTVLFADLVGFTSRAEQLDPEDVRAVLAPYWERLRSELERFGGTVEKFIGDAVMALFGAPVSREDDPERAVRAALAIRDWAREEPDLQVRIAVTTGEALIVLGARPSEGEGMAAGDVVNTAARLQSAAPVNGILVAEPTYRATRDAIDYVEAEPVVAKGKTEPVRVWEAVNARSRLGMDLEQRALLPLVGRVRELEAVLGAFDRARGELEPQLVTLVGVPGIGKSRLVAELFHRVDEGVELVWWRQGRALPYGDGVSFWALTEMVKAQAGIQENDALEVAREKLWESVGAAVGEDDRLWVGQHLLPLIGATQAERADSPSESFPAWRRYFEGLAEQRPLVLVFEDLHWADDGLLDFVDHLADWATGVPLFLVGTARPELLDRRPEWGGGKLNATTLALSPLADAEAAQIIGRVLEQALLSAETQQVLLERAGGNPLYAEQFARLYVERGSSDDLPLPETIQGIIAARLDGLTPEEKRLLQDAAVLGKVFWSGAAASLAGLDEPALEQALHSLARKGLIRRERRSAVSGEDEYAFRHVLVRDVAYGQIPRAQRGRKHVQAAAWVESLGRADDHAELVAHHYAAALELVGAAGPVDDELATSARVALRRAGERALRLSNFPSAERFFEEALVLWPDDAERAHVMFAHARARFQAEGADDRLLESLEALERTGDTEAAAEAAVLCAHAAWRGGRPKDTEAMLSRALASLEGAPPSPALAAALAESARIAVFGARLDEASALTDDALRITQHLGLVELEATALNTLGVARLMEGRVRDAAAIYHDVVDRDLSRSSELTRAMINLGVVYETDGFPGEAARWARRANDSATRNGDRTQLIWLESSELRYDVYGRGSWDEALERLTAFLELIRPLGGHYLEPGIRAVRACVLAAFDEVERAVEDIETSLRLLDDRSDLQTIVPTSFECAHAELTLGNLDHARELVARVVPIVSKSPHRAPGIAADNAVAVVRTGYADEFLTWHGNLAETGRSWASGLVYRGKTAAAADLYERIGTDEEAAATRLLAAEQLVGEGRRAEADVQLHKALAFYRAAGATRIVRDAERLLAEAI
jgi:class 3 adenylate cyclase/tetratricopeptide (TPR) repeat protein